jgi:hypothetical protein
MEGERKFLNIVSSERAFQALAIVLQHLMVPDLGWNVNFLDIRRRDIKKSLELRFARNEVRLSEDKQVCDEVDVITTVLEKPLQEDTITKDIILKLKTTNLFVILHGLQTIEVSCQFSI